MVEGTLRSRWDHPRSRGVYWCGCSRALSRVGSSPLARGLHAGGVHQGAVGGIIPARAGFTAPRRAPRPRGRDHPRSRGVYVETSSSLLLASGSSPLARGLHSLPGAVEPGVWIIPARAGFTLGGSLDRVLDRDHPRSRGVYVLKSPQIGSQGGSSPLARGLQALDNGDPRAVRIIPARAGFTVHPGGGGPGLWDHPRSRGVYLGGVREKIASLDHPRSRGVYHLIIDAGRVFWGSSPLARGLQRLRRRPRRGRRIIPARAGFTRCRCEAGRQDQDHPRSRGVYATARRKNARTAGSSPLARGLPLPWYRTLPEPGIIPARAGFTGR